MGIATVVQTGTDLEGLALSPHVARAQVRKQDANDEWKKAREGKVEPAEGAIFCCVHHKRYSEGQARKRMRKWDDWLATDAELQDEQLGMFPGDDVEPTPIRAD